MIYDPPDADSEEEREAEKAKMKEIEADHGDDADLLPMQVLEEREKERIVRLSSTNLSQYMT